MIGHSQIVDRRCSSASLAASCSASFLLAPGRFGQRLAAHDDFHLEQLAMIGAERADEPVLRQRRIPRLHQLLQRRLVVLPGRAGTLSVGEQRRELAGHECARVLDAAVEVDRRDERLVAVGEQRLLAAAAGLLLAAPEQQVIAEVQALGHAGPASPWTPARP